MDQTQDKEYPFLEHLEEMRWAILKCLICMAIFFPVCYIYTPFILESFIKHFGPEGLQLRYFSVMEAFFVELKLAFFITFFISFPFVSYQIWSFIAPGLMKHERLNTCRLMFFSILLFAMGSIFALTVIWPLVLKFALSYQTDYIQANLGINSFISTALMLSLGFGVIFQFPIIIFCLVKIGLIEIQTLKKLRPVIVTVILILSAVLTPPDVISQLLMALPTYLMFELTLLFISTKKIKNKIPEEILYEQG